jgi:aspartate-semialdehyde dehydrogenase
VFYSHAESVFVETQKEVTPEALTQRLSASQGVVPRMASDDYPMQIDIAGQDDIHVGRIRKDESVPFGLSMWIVADNVRKGAALNAVQIVESLVQCRT